MQGKENYAPLSRRFYQGDTHDVARRLLGKVLIRRWNDVLLAGRITEVESYVSEDDNACHAARGRTPRTEIMFGPPGHAYVYLIYGMYHCLNVVTGKKGYAAAVLIRALEPLVGLETMQQFRPKARPHEIANGPGKLARALQIDRDLNTEDLTLGASLWISDDGYQVTSDQIATSPRIGVEYAGEHALLPWRYYLRESRFVSKTPRPKQGK